MAVTQFPCGKCGADFDFDPAAQSLKCPFCGHENPIPDSEEKIEELDFEKHVASLGDEVETYEITAVKCDVCGAESSFEANITSDECPFCGSHLIQEGASKKLIKPKSLLPFKIEEKDALELFRSWLKGLWFAPSRLKKYARSQSKLQGLYVPHWTYDCKAESAYRGQRGDYYYVNQSYTTTQNGRTVTKTRRVRRIRWSWRNGRVHNTFDDVLILASESLPKKYAEKLEPWDLAELVPYSDEYLSGFRSESYQVDLLVGFSRAKDIMEETIRKTVRRDIGGDQQRILSLATRHEDISFKHILLPIWLSVYRYREKIYRFLVNARTGEVQGERPWSWVKIASLVVGILAAAGSGYFLYVRASG